MADAELNILRFRWQFCLTYVTETEICNMPYGIDLFIILKEFWRDLENINHKDNVL